MTGKSQGIPDDVRARIERLVRERGSVPTTDQMFRHGREYHECALRCLELRDGQGFVFQPSLVLLALVVELYLKGLVAIEGKDPRADGHNLSGIYGGLTTETQANVAERYRQRHRGQILPDDLPAYSDIFLKVRYAYELEGARQDDISGVAQFASSLYETWAEL